MRRRDRDYERRIAPAYLERVGEAYRQFFYHYTETPLLVVQSSEIDFVQRPDDFDALLKEIQTVKHGVQHYVPLDSRRGR
jgi:deoxyadenosine/deoxycytidine kinase